MKKNQLDSSSVREALVSQRMNLIQSPAQKCKHSTIYTHTWYAQTPEMLKEFICRITGPGFAYLIRKPAIDLTDLLGGESKGCFGFFCSYKIQKDWRYSA